MSRWLIFSLLATGLAAAPLFAQDPTTPKAKAKTEPKTEAPKSKPKTEAKPKTEPPKAEVLDEKTIKERASYAIGQNFGKNLAKGIKQDGADVDTDVILQGIKDALTNAKPAYSEAELTAAIEAFGKALEAKTAAAGKAAADKNKKEGETFLADNKKKKDVQTTATGLHYKVLKKGDGKTPQKTDSVRVHYHGTLPDGTVFDSSKERGEAVQSPVTGVIKG